MSTIRVRSRRDPGMYPGTKLFTLRGKALRKAHRDNRRALQHQRAREVHRLGCVHCLADQRTDRAQRTERTQRVDRVRVRRWRSIKRLWRLGRGPYPDYGVFAHNDLLLEHEKKMEQRRRDHAIRYAPLYIVAVDWLNPNPTSSAPSSSSL